MTRSARVREMYDHHPISVEHILEKLEAEHGRTSGLSPTDLFPHDQDHYGGLEANDAIAERAGLAPGMEVADFCAGLGGPARYLAHKFGVRVTGVELNARRVEGAGRLNRIVGLEGAVEVIEGDVTASGLPSARFDAVVSQEAFLHVPDKAAVLDEAYRVLKPGGRLVFTDWTNHRALSSDDADVLWQGLAAQTLRSPAEYEALLEDAGFTVEDVEDLSAEWAEILEQRFAMYTQLRAETSASGLPEGEDAFYRAYERLVALVQDGDLGGGRFTALK